MGARKSVLGRCIHELFRAQAGRTPHATALIGKKRRYTYEQLDVLTDQLASYLAERGVGSEKIVGCWLHDSSATVVQVLAILKAGGAYLLLDPHLPVQRLQYMLDDANPFCIIADRVLPAALGLGRTVITTRQMRTAPSTPLPPVAHVTPDNLAYIAYTSGSTGRPKGVLTTHAAIVSYALAFNKRLKLGPGDRTPLMAPLGFDMATEEMIPPLVAGCTLIDAPARFASMQAFTDDIAANGYTILNIPAPLWHQWTTYLHESHNAIPPKLRLVIAGSDKIYTTKLREWNLLPGAEHVQWAAAYGVTEAAVTSTLYIASADDDMRHESLVPIGTPLDHVTAYVVRQDGSLADTGEAGELWIGGDGLARGYNNLPEKTAECFVPDRFSRRPKARLYKTGDLVRRRADGTLIWLGRQDSQVKINGLRIELAEVEAAIHHYPHINEVVVICVPGSAQQANQLVAYVEPKAGTVLDRHDLRKFLTAQLHPQMVPSRIIAVDKIPLSANGKIDRKILQKRQGTT